MENMKPQDKNVFGEGHRKAGPVSKATEPGQTQADVPYYQPLVILSKLSTGLHDPCRSCLPFVYKYKLTPKNVIWSAGYWYREAVGCYWLKDKCFDEKALSH